MLHLSWPCSENKKGFMPTDKLRLSSHPQQFPYRYWCTILIWQIKTSVQRIHGCVGMADVSIQTGVLGASVILGSRSPLIKRAAFQVGLLSFLSFIPTYLDTNVNLYNMDPQIPLRSLPWAYICCWQWRTLGRPSLLSKSVGNPPPHLGKKSDIFPFALLVVVAGLKSRNK